MRRLSLPPASAEEMERLLLLQIESEFPLAPAEMAWGYRSLNGRNGARPAPGHEVLVAAVKKEFVEEYASILTEAGVNPVFTLAAFARGAYCPQPLGTFSVLDLGSEQSELISFDHGVPTMVRVLRWGTDNVIQTLETSASLTREEATRQLTELERPGASEANALIRRAVQSELLKLAQSLPRESLGGKLFVTGRLAGWAETAASLSQQLAGLLPVEALPSSGGPGQTAATVGLQRASRQSGGLPILILEVNPGRHTERRAPDFAWQWAILAVALVAAILALRFLDPFLRRPALARRVAQVREYRQVLPGIDRELGFLQYIDQNRAPYLDATYLLANATQPGTKIDSLAMNRRGEVAFRGAVQNAQQVLDFRSKLIDSGFFASVVIDEQSPTPDRQRLNFRITAQWKPFGARPVLPEPPAGAADAKSGRPGGPPMGGQPGAGPMPPPMNMPMPMPMNF